jgi:hypothetical protein
MNKRTRQKRVRIASDAIAQIKAKKLIPARDGYCNIYTIVNDDTQLNKAIKANKARCEVCALGSLLIADVIKNNHLTIDEASNYGFDEINSRLANIFDTKTLMILEFLFEDTSAGALYNLIDQEIGSYSDIKDEYYFASATFTDKEIDLYNYYSKSLPSDSEDRLLILLRNIVRNDGEFIIPRDIVRKHEKEYKKEVASCS